MGLDASVRCRCFEEHKLRPGPVPYDDLYIDKEGYLSSRKLDNARRRFGYRQFQARYGRLESAFDEWAERCCEHEDGDLCSERVGNWSGVATFEGYCKEIGEDRLPILSHMLPDGNGGTFPAEMAAAALAELDVFDAWLDEKMETNPTSVLIDVSTHKEVWSPEGGRMDIYARSIDTADMAGGEFRVVDDNHHEGEVLFSSSHFTHAYIDDPSWKGEHRQYILTDLATGKSIRCWEGFEFCEAESSEFVVGSRRSWAWTLANVALRKLLMASLETGNPIRWC